MPRSPFRAKPRLRLVKPPRRTDRFGLIVIGVVAAAFAGTLWVLTPEAPGRGQVQSLVRERTTDQHFANCADARRQGRQNIPRWDPSYRERMDRDRDGLACEPYLF